MTLTAPLLPRRLLVPLDLSPVSEPILQYAAELARELGASVELLYVWEPPTFVSPETMMALPGWNAEALEKEAIADGRKKMDALAASSALAGLSVTAHVEVGNIAASILRAAERAPGTVIVMGTHGRTGLSRIVLGSVAQKIVSGAPCPVLTIRTPGELPQRRGT